MNLLRASANRLSACRRALRPWLWRTLLPDAVLDPNGQASHAQRSVQGSRRQEHGTTHAGGPRAQQRRANCTGTFRVKPRRNGRACGWQYLRSAICACWVISRKPDIERNAKPRSGHYCSAPTLTSTCSDCRVMRFWRLKDGLQLTRRSSCHRIRANSSLISAYPRTSRANPA
jgi:hypothetical protein